MFKHTLHEDTKNYLKTLLVEDDAPASRKSEKKSKKKKDDKSETKDSAVLSTTAAVDSFEKTKAASPTPIIDSTVVVEPSKTSLSPEEQKEKEEQEQSKQEKERRERTIDPDRTSDERFGRVIDKEYKKSIESTSGGPIEVFRTEKGPIYNVGYSGRGRGAPSVSDEPEDRTGISKYKDKPYNYDVLVGKSLPKITSLSSKPNQDPLEQVFAPYKELQSIKLLKTFIPNIFQKIAASKKVSKSGMEQTEFVTPGKPQNWTGTATGKTAQLKELSDAGILDNNSLSQQMPEEVIDAAYKAADADFQGKEPADGFSKMVRRQSALLSGLGGLDPHFGKELALKLLGGEWIEKAMQNIAPSQERGVISSMGNRSSIGM